MNKDFKGYYRILELETNATNEEIKRGYKCLARKHHPDRENGNEEMFRNIQEAYDTLSDDDKKTLYDRNLDSDIYKQDVHMHVFDLSDLLKNMFNMEDENEFTGVEDGQKHIKQSNVELSLDDVVFGCIKIITYENQIKCSKCDLKGYTHSGLIHCLRCNGQGYMPSFPFPTVCPSCNGESIIRQNLQQCKDCENGFKNELMEAEIKLKSGINHNTKIDVNTRLTVLVKHRYDMKKIKIKSNDIIIKQVIKIEEALLGFKTKIYTTKKDGTILLKSDKYIDTTQPWIIENKGICYDDNKRGNLIIQFVIEGSEFPDKIIKFKKAFQKIFA
jgi:molecular chaperone DnaJ